MTASKVSVVICTRDRPDTVGQAVESVASCDHPGFDLHVMDQSTTDETRKIVEALAERFADRCRIVYHHLEIAGLSRAYNAGVRACEGSVVACTDDDVVVPSDWLATIVRAFDEDPELGLLYGQVLIPASLRAAEASDEIIVPSLTWTARQRLHRHDRNFKVWGMGADMAVRRTAFERVGGFDEAMGGGAPLRSSQDFDFSLRVYRSGFAVLLDPAVTVDHYGTRTHEQWAGTGRNYGIGDGAFYTKHIRCGDLLALRLLLVKIAMAFGHLVRDSFRARRPVGMRPYSRGVFTGIRESSRFGVDRTHRLYRATARAQLSVTEANVVTGALRDGT